VSDDSRTVRIEGIGPVRFERSRRARRLSITVRPDRSVRVAVPAGISYRRAIHFAERRARWAQSQFKRLENVQRLSDRLHELDPERARQQLVRRCRQLAAQFGFEFNRISVRRQRSRWGSCSAKKNINLNMQLMLLPADIRDYVILHELVHTRVNHHGPDFWRELIRVCPKAEQLRRSLNRYAPADLRGRLKTRC